MSSLPAGLDCVRYNFTVTSALHIVVSRHLTPCASGLVGASGREPHVEPHSVT